MVLRIGVTMTVWCTAPYKVKATVAIEEQWPVKD